MVLLEQTVEEEINIAKSNGFLIITTNTLFSGRRNKWATMINHNAVALPIRKI